MLLASRFATLAPPLTLLLMMAVLNESDPAAVPPRGSTADRSRGLLPSERRLAQGIGVFVRGCGIVANAERIVAVQQHDSAAAPDPW